MSRLILILAAFIAFNANALSKETPDNTKENYKTLEQLNIEAILFEDDNLANYYFDLDSFEVIEIEEEININFDTKMFLPEGFNPLEGMHDIDWNTIELVELDEEIELGFDTKKHLPKDFNSLAGMYDLDWNTIELVELEEEVILEFDTKKYLPNNFNALAGMHDLDWNTIELIELEEEIEIGFDVEEYLPIGFNPYKIISCEREIVVCLY